MTRSDIEGPTGDRLSAEHLTPINLVKAWMNTDDPHHTQARAVIQQAFSYMKVWDMKYGMISCYFAKWLLHCTPSEG
jgi:cytochrome P450